MTEIKPEPNEDAKAAFLKRAEEIASEPADDETDDAPADEATADEAVEAEETVEA